MDAYESDLSKDSSDKSSGDSSSVRVSNACHFLSLTEVHRTIRGGGTILLLEYMSDLGH